MFYYKKINNVLKLIGFETFSELDNKSNISVFRLSLHEFLWSNEKGIENGDSLANKSIFIHINWFIFLLNTVYKYVYINIMKKYTKNEAKKTKGKCRFI